VGMAFFRGGFSRHAAQNILGASLFFLDALVNKSILRHAGSDRYLMHELIRQQLLTHKDNEQAVYQFFNKRYATYYLEIVAGLKARVNQSQEKEALAAISLDFENMRAAWNWAVKNKVYTLIQPAVQGWFFFFEQRGRFKEGQEAFESILQQLKSDLFEDIPENLKSLTASVLGILGKFHYHLGDYQQSEAYLVRALADFKAIERPEKVAFIQYEKAILKRAQGDYQRARELLNDSLLYYQEVGDQRSQGDILNSLGVIASGLGEIELAEQYYSACLEIFQELADPGKISRALNNLGYSYLEKGDYTASLPFLEKSLEISQDISAGPLSAAVLESLGSLYFAMGDYISSTRYYRDALRLCVKLNALPLTLEILLGFSKIFSSQGEWQQALELMCLVYHHPSVVHEVRARAQQMLSACEHSQAQYCLSLNQVEITSLDVDHAISNILFPH
jgi:tetratricopeptide (TPR) repeat protein